jgi:transposase
MVTIGVDPHKGTHSAVAVDAVGRQLSGPDRAGEAGRVRGAAGLGAGVERSRAERLVAARTRLINELRWQLHDLWPECEIPKRALVRPEWQRQVARRLQRAEATARVRIARDEIARVRDLTRTIAELYAQLSELVAEVAPQLLAERGVGVLIAAKLIGEIAGIDRFATDAKLARLAACAPIPVQSGRTDRYRLDPGGNRQLNHAFHMLAITKIIHDPETALYIAKQRGSANTNRDAIRSLKRYLVRRVYNLLRNPTHTPTAIHCG